MSCSVTRCGEPAAVEVVFTGQQRPWRFCWFHSRNRRRELAWDESALASLRWLDTDDGELF